MGFSGFEISVDAYSRLDCESRTLCVLVLAREGFTISNSMTNSWIKDYESSLPGKKYPGKGKGIQFVRRNGMTVGWEGCFEVPDFDEPLRKLVEIHANYGSVGQGECGNTASTGKKARSPISLGLC